MAFTSKRHARVAANARVWQTLLVQYFALLCKRANHCQAVHRARFFGLAPRPRVAEHALAGEIPRESAHR